MRGVSRRSRYADFVTAHDSDGCLVCRHPDFPVFAALSFTGWDEGRGYAYPQPGRVEIGGRAKAHSRAPEPHTPLPARIRLGFSGAAGGAGWDLGLSRREGFLLLTSGKREK